MLRVTRQPPKSRRDPNPDFDAVVAEAQALQAQLPWIRLICVGGTAAALHAGHRFSTDSDHAGEHVRDQFEAVRVALMDWEGWKNNRIRHPVAIIGERHGIQVGVRQQLRRFPPDATQIQDVWVPMPEETLRIKAWMIADRGATRDFLDVAAFGDLLGTDRAADASAPLSAHYDPVGTETATMRFAQAAMGRPADEQEVDLYAYRGLQAPYRDLDYVLRRVRDLAVPALERELSAPAASPPPASPSTASRGRGPGPWREPMSDISSPAASARLGRITEQESFLDLIDHPAYADLATWRRLYLAAMVDPGMRENIVQAAQRVDPDFVTAGLDWQALILRMPTVAAAPDRAAQASAAASGARRKEGGAAPSAMHRAPSSGKVRRQ